MEEIISYFYEVFIPKIIDVRINFGSITNFM